MLVLASGYFDPLTNAHVQYLREASKLGDLWVLVNNDACAIRKKGFSFMNENERLEIVLGIKGVESAGLWGEDTVASAIRKYKPRYFAKGGDRNLGTLPMDEIEACAEVGCEIVCGVGGGKTQSSSWILKKYADFILGKA